MKIELTEKEAKVVLLAIAELGNAEPDYETATLLDSAEAKIRQARRGQR